MAGIETSGRIFAPFNVGLNAGSMAMRAAVSVLEPYASRLFVPPTVDGETGLIAQRPINEAKIGRQLVVIGRRMDRDRRERPSILAAGHFKIADAVLATDTQRGIPDSVTEEVVNIAVRTGTDPVRLAPDHLDEFNAFRAASIIDDFEAYARS